MRSWPPSWPSLHPWPWLSRRYSTKVEFENDFLFKPLSSFKYSILKALLGLHSRPLPVMAHDSAKVLKPYFWNWLSSLWAGVLIVSYSLLVDLSVICCCAHNAIAYNGVLSHAVSCSTLVLYVNVSAFKPFLNKRRIVDSHCRLTRIQDEWEEHISVSNLLTDEPLLHHISIVHGCDTCSAEPFNKICWQQLLFLRACLQARPKGEVFALWRRCMTHLPQLWVKLCLFGSIYLYLNTSQLSSEIGIVIRWLMLQWLNDLAPLDVPMMFQNAKSEGRP